MRDFRYGDPQVSLCGISAIRLGHNLGTASVAEPLASSVCSRIMDGQGCDPVADPQPGLIAVATRTDNEIRELTTEQGRQLLDDKARQYLGISGEEFRARWEAGEIDADDEPDVMRVAMLLPLAG
jgi:hypothetical protein